jgi:DNA topoisomerase-2
LTQSSLKTKPASKKRPKPIEDDDEEDDSRDPFLEGDSAHDATLLSNTPPSANKRPKKAAPVKKPGGKPLQEVENESMHIEEVAITKTKTKSNTEHYQMMTQLEHIIHRPDTYIGSVERTEQQMWVYNSETEEMELRKISYVPGLYKIFDEILVNAADNKQNDAAMKYIKVKMDKEAGEIMIENDGKGIPVEIHEVRFVSNIILLPSLLFFRNTRFTCQKCCLATF